jgi:hypothetical protein
LIAISMLVLFGLPLLAPVFAPNAAEASIPACCSRGGRHHCAMSEMAGQQPSGHAISVMTEKCPYAPAVAPVLHLTAFAPPSDAAVFAQVVSHPAIHAQTEARYRISFDRARQKRGPPFSDFISCSVS